MFHQFKSWFIGSSNKLLIYVSVYGGAGKDVTNVAHGSCALKAAKSICNDPNHHYLSFGKYFVTKNIWFGGYTTQIPGAYNVGNMMIQFLPWAVTPEVLFLERNQRKKYKYNSQYLSSRESSTAKIEFARIWQNKAAVSVRLCGQKYSIRISIEQT